MIIIGTEQDGLTDNTIGLTKITFPDGRVRIHTGKQINLKHLPYDLAKLQKDGARVENISKSVTVWAALRPLAGAAKRSYFQVFEDRDDLGSRVLISLPSGRSVLQSIIDGNLKLSNGWIEGEWEFTLDHTAKISLRPKNMLPIQNKGLAEDRNCGLQGDEDVLVFDEDFKWRM